MPAALKTTASISSPYKIRHFSYRANLPSQDDPSSQERSEFWRLMDSFFECKQQMERLSALHKNWDSYSADPPNPRSLELASNVLETLKARLKPPSKIVPSREGGVGFCFIRHDRYADIECFNSGEILGVFYAGKQTPRIIETEPNDAGIVSAVEQVLAFVNE